MIEGKGLGGRRPARRNVSMTNKEESDLRKLATACNKNTAEMMWLLIRRSLYDEMVIHELQNEYCTQSAYKVVLVKKDGELHFTLSGREDI